MATHQLDSSRQKTPNSDHDARRSRVGCGGRLLGHLPLSLGQLAGAPAAELDECIVAVQEHRQETEKRAGKQRGTEGTLGEKNS